MYISEGKKHMLRELGPAWRIQVIDLEPCVYRDLGKHDIEVSAVHGLKGSKISIYVWDKADLTIIERLHNLTIDQAIDVCRCFEARYAGR